MAITLEQAKKLYHNQELYHTIYRDSKGEPQKWRVAGMPRTWKTMPERVVVPLRYGFQKSTAHMSEREIDQFCLKKWEATGTKIRYKKVLGRRFTYYDVIFGKEKVPYKRLWKDRKIGSVYKDHSLNCWFNNQEKYRFKTRACAAKSLLDAMLD